MASELAVGYISLAISTRGLGRDIAKQFTGIERQADQSGRRAGSRLGSGIASALKGGVVAAGAAVVATISTALVKGFKRLDAIDQATAKLKGLGHSAKTVSRIMDDALASVKGTAFGLDEAASVAASAVAAGIKPGLELQRTLKLVADAATIGGTSMAEMGSIFNKVAASGKVTGDVINQMSDRGIPILQMLGKVMGKSAAEVSKLVSEGKVDFATFQKALEKGLGGAALKSGDTFSGALKNMGAALGRFGANLLKGVFPQLKGVFKDITTALDSMGPVAEKIGKSLGKAFAALIKFAGPLLQRVPGLLTEIKRGFDGLVAGLKFGSSEITSSADSLGGIGERIGAAFHNVGKVALPVLRAILPVLRDVGRELLVGLKQNAQQALPVMKQIGSALIAAIPAVLAALRAVGNLLVTYVIPAVTKMRAIIIAFATQALPVIIAGFRVLGQFIITQVVPALVGIGRAVAGLLRVVVPIVLQIVGAIVGKFREMQPQIAGIWNSVKEIITGVMAIIHQVVKIATHIIRVMWEKNGSGILRAVKGTFGGVIKIIGGAMKIVAGIVSLILAVITGDKKKAMAAWKTIWTGVKNIVVGIWLVIRNTVVRLVATLLSELLKKFKVFLSWIAGNFKASLAKVTDYILNPIRSARDKLKTLMDQITSRFKAGVNAIGKAWDALKAKAAAPVRFIINTVINGGLIRAFNAIARKVGASTLANVPSFAVGGWTGPGAKMRPAGIVHADEHVWTKEEMRRFPGGHKAMEALRAKYRRGVHGDSPDLPGFAGGGKVGKVKDKVTSANKTIGKFLVTTVTKLVSMGATLKAALDKALGSMSGAGSSAFGDLAKGMGRKVRDALYQKGKDWVQKIVTVTKKKIPTISPGGKIGTVAAGAGWGPIMAAMRRHGARNFTTYPGHHPSAARARDVTPHNWGAANAARALSSVWYVIYRMRIASKNHGNGWRPYHPTNFNGDWRHTGHIHVARYDKGGDLKPGLTLAHNVTGQRERVLTPVETRNYESGRGGLTINGGVHGHTAADVAREIEKLRRRQATLQPSMI